MYIVMFSMHNIKLDCITNVCVRSYETEVYKEWTIKVEEVSKTNLEKPLLIRNDDTSQLTVNFDPEVQH